MRMFRHAYTADEYDVIEGLLRRGLPLARIARRLAPPVTPNALRLACDAAGIDGGRLPHRRPSFAEQAALDELERQIEADGGFTYIDEQARKTIAALADSLGYTVVITKKPPENRAPADCHRKK